MTSTHCSIALPAGFRAEDILEFHRRDPQAFAERVAPGLGFHPAHVDAELAIDSRSTAANEAALTRLICRMLGLTQRIEVFEQDYRQHPQLGPLIARQSGLRVPLAATPFEALTWAITGQQISVGAAVSMRRKLIKAAGPTHSSRERLLDIRGIGPWTVNYTLLRGFGWLDGSLHGDVAVRHGMQILLDSPDKISEKAAQQWLAEFSPWRALLAAHLWALKSLVA